MDGYLITKSEAFAHWFQRWTGRTNFWLLSVSCWVAASCIVAELWVTLTGSGAVQWLGVTGYDHDFKWLPFLGYVCVLCFAFDGTFYWKRLENEAYARLSRGLSNPLKIIFAARAWRLFLVFSWLDFVVTQVTLRHPSIELQSLALAWITYLRACDPLPPCTGKLFERTPALAEAACQS